jgi:hypothetical protein
LRAVRLPLDLLCHRLKERSEPGSVCHSIVRRAVLEGEGEDRFQIYWNEMTLKWCRRWLEIYGLDDPELADRLKPLIAEAAPRIEAGARKARAKDAEEAELELALR